MLHLQLLLLAFAVLAPASTAVAPATQEPGATIPVADDETAKDETIEVRLTAQVPDEATSLRWSPKGAQIELVPAGEALTGALALGPRWNDQPPRSLSLALTKSDGAAHFDQLWFDLDGDGIREREETRTCSPSESRGKIWSSFELTLELPVLPGEGTRAYPISLWFVEDPLEPDAAPVLRWSRRGWHQGSTLVDGERVFVLITESEMDGIFDEADAWFLSSDESGLAAAAGSRSLGRHAWLGERAFRLQALDPNGLWIRFEPFDPGVTRAEEERLEDVLFADRNAERAAEPLAFRHDFVSASATAVAEGRPLLIDFETTWCGPCKQMDSWVYTAKAVVDQATTSSVLAVKVDGDDHRDLKERFGVTAFPTMILLGPDGVELRRHVGYLGVEDMVVFLTPEKDA